MTGRILSFAKSPHQAAQELLPWYLNGTLDADEGAQVEQHLHGCAACRAELQSQRDLQAAYVQTDLAPAAEGALNRLLPRLDPVKPPESGSGVAAAAPWRSVVPAWGNLFPVWIRVGLAAQFGVIVALGWALLQPERPTAQEYHVLSAPGAPARPAGDVAVVFDPAAPQREVEQILRSAGARVVDGPSASRSFVLVVPEGKLQSALAVLRSERLVVVVAPLEAEKSP